MRILMNYLSRIQGLHCAQSLARFQDDVGKEIDLDPKGAMSIEGTVTLENT